MDSETWWSDANSENTSRRTFCQIPFSSIYEQANKGKQSLLRLVEFFRRKAEAERSASTEMRALMRQHGLGQTSLEDLEEHGTSIRRAITEVRQFVEATTTHQMLLAKVLQEQVAEPLVSLQAASETYIQTLEDEIKHVNDDYALAQQVLMDASMRLRKTEEELLDARERQRLALHGIGVPEFELQRLAARVTRCLDERSQAEEEKRQAKQVLYNRIIARDEMAMAVSVAYQKAEEERLDQLHQCLDRFLHMETERIKIASGMLESLKLHVENINRSEDIQLLIHNRRNPDNMHFQGKALALLDWHWMKTHRSTGSPIRRRKHDSFELDSDEEKDLVELGHVEGSEMLSTVGSEHAASEQSYLGAKLAKETSLSDQEHELNCALQHFFGAEPTGGDDCSSTNDVTVANLNTLSLDEDLSDTRVNDGYNSVSNVTAINQEMHNMIQVQCETHAGRAAFVRCLNRQRSLDTQLKDKPSFLTLVDCFNVFLDCCVRDDDVKAAKTAMILAETFYVSRTATGEEISPTRSATEQTEHPLASSGSMADRGAKRMYLQVEVKKHPIWKSPSFWEKALLLAIGEELQKTPQAVAWEDLPTVSSARSASSPLADHFEGLPTREEAVSRVHNIVFGQLGSFTLSMLEFDVPIKQILSFIETMCDAHELTEDQRYLLRKNLHEIFAALRPHDAKQS